jgi:2-hydroxy-3-keto-5-methylthiopentenyl-1-phosphate phosphatase
MDYRALFPLADFNSQGQSKYDFKSCLTMQDFISEVIRIYFSEDSDLRVQECCLSVYMAFRDHYPSYLENVDQEVKEKLNFQIERAGGKVIKLRRIVISAISKVA